MKKVTGWLCGLLLLVVVVTLPMWWNRPQAVLYTMYRDQGRQSALEHLTGFERVSSEHFTVYYTETDADVAHTVLQTAERSWAPVTQALGFEPPGLAPLVIYADRDSLRQAFGWSAQESAMGVYWRGVIRLLSPHVWADAQTPEEEARIFQRLGPLPHEFTHYVLDYLTAGNYPRWFTEGLAQSVEYRVSRYQWVEEANRLDQSNLYSLSELSNHFDTLSNQALAYRESFCMVEYLYSHGGGDSMRKLVDSLARGLSFEESLSRVYGLTTVQLDQQWLPWARQQAYITNPA